MNFTNIIRNDETCYTIDLEHPIHGWIPFSASENDPEESGREVFAEVKAYVDAHPEGDYSPVPPTDEEQLAMDIAREQAWVKGEMEFADEEIRALEDGEGIGIEQDWRTYRVALRAWPNHPSYPDSVSRPFYITSG